MSGRADVRVGAAVIGTAATLLAFLVGLLGAAPAAEAATPAVSVAVGHDGGVYVELRGWPVRASASVSVCGHRGLNGSVDCDSAASILVVLDAAGEGRAELQAAHPPAACPCVVRAASLVGGLTATAPAPAAVVAGIRAPATSASARSVDPAAVSGSGPPAAAPGRSVSVLGWSLGVAGVLVGLVAVIMVAGLVRTALRQRRWRHVRGSSVRLIAALSAAASAACLITVSGQLIAPGLKTAAAQRQLTEQLTEKWSGPGLVSSPLGDVAAPADGSAFGVLHVPRWGPQTMVFVEGISPDDLAKGPGHYPGTAVPGAVGNFALAGHRGPAGEPFNDIDALRPGDAIVVETAQSWFVYRVTSHSIVAPNRVQVVAPVPDQPGAAPTAAVLTLTACHPRYSARQRYIVHAELAETRPRSAGTPAVLQTG